MLFGGVRLGKRRASCLLLLIALMTILLMNDALIGQAPATLPVVLIDTFLNKPVLASVVLPVLLVLGNLFMPQMTRYELASLQDTQNIERHILSRVGWTCILIALGEILGGVVMAVFDSQMVHGALPSIRELLIFALLNVWFVPVFMLLQTLKVTRVSLIGQISVLAAVVVVDFGLITIPIDVWPIGFGGVTLLLVKASWPIFLMDLASLIITVGLVWGFSKWRISTSDYFG